jgi:signal transduction histidine kinase
MSTPAGVLFIPDAGTSDSRDLPPTRTLDRIVHLAALATRATVAQINLVSDDRQIPVAMHVDETRAGTVEDIMTSPTWRITMEHAPAYALTSLDTAESFAIEDTHAYPIAREKAADVDDRIRSFAATRLKTPAGVVLGSLFVADYTPRAWSSDEQAALVECAALAGQELASHLAIVETERSRLEAEQAQHDIEEVSRAKSDLLAVFSRELRAQLDTLAAHAELLQADARTHASTARRDELRRVQLGQRHLASLIDEVLSYSNLEQGAVDFALTTVGIRDALLEVERALAPQARAKAITVALGDVRGDMAIVADRGRVHETLTRLLSNAVKFTGPGGRIDLACDATRSDVRIRIRDTGIGIPADKLDVIFEPFVQLRADLERTVEDAGLGLAISRALARAQGGDLTVESTVGAGSTFTLTLPRAKTST